MGNRKPIPKETETRVLTSSKRRCALCFGLRSDLSEKKGQIAHLDQDPSNPAFDNLAWLCFDHHDAYDGRTRQSKNYTIEEIKTYRNKLYKEIAENKLNDAAKTTKNNYFDAGTRIKVVREELGLTTSQFIELLELESQRDYEAMERREREIPLGLLTKVSNVSGVQAEWLKHEKPPRYKIEQIYLRSIQDDLEYCASLKPQEYFLTLDKKQLHIGLVVQTSEYRYQVMDTGVTLDFWNWIDSHWAIPAFYHFLKDLSDPWHDIVGISLPTRCDKQLYNGEIHFLTALRNDTREAGDLVYDLLDLYDTRLDFPYSKKYGGNWMDRVHEEFKKHVHIDKVPLYPQSQPTAYLTWKRGVRHTVTFREPTQLPSYERNIVWMFPFDVVETKFLNQPEEMSQTSLHDITVIATFELVSTWNLAHLLTFPNTQDESKRNDEDRKQLMKILFWYGKKNIEKKLQERTLQGKEKLSLTTSSPEVRDRLDPNRIPEPNGLTFGV